MYKNEQYNLVVDPLLSDNEYWQLNSFPITLAGTNTLEVGDILDYTISHYLLNNINLNILIGNAIVVKIKDIEKGIKVELLGSSIKYKKIKKDKDCYLFFIDSSPGAYLRIRITNISKTSIPITRVDANTGLIPFNFGIPTTWEKNKYGKIHIKDTSVQSLLVEGGSDILGDSLYRGNLTINKDLTIKQDLTIEGSINVLGPSSEFHTETVKSKDNNIDLNVDGTDITAHNGGITILNSGKAFDPAILWDNQFGAWKTKGGFLGGIPLGAVVDISGTWDGPNNTGTFVEIDTSVSGEIDENGLMLADGVICPANADPAFAGRYIPNLCDDRFLMGGTVAGAISVSDGVNLGDNRVQLRINEMPNHRHGGGSGGGRADIINGKAQDIGQLNIQSSRGQLVGNTGGSERISGMQMASPAAYSDTAGQGDEVRIWAPGHWHNVTGYVDIPSSNINPEGEGNSFDIRPKWHRIKRKMRVK